MLNKSNFIDIFSYVDEETGAVKERSIIIPIIQRDYAQGRTDEQATRVRTKFLKALYLAVTETPITLDFIYGGIKDDVITLLDGQQRATTLFLLYLYAAKKAGCDKSEYEFLKRFSYETRYSSRVFCANLVDYTPDFGKKLSEDIEDQAWFTLGWKNDPTIKSMLVMIDAIQEQFRDVPDLWDKLKSDAITFYFLPIEKMGLTDELYIKMNSRGKMLSEFENFKAEFEGEISKHNKERAVEISRKIDGVWTDLLWGYKDESNTIDNAFLSLFRVICQIIAYKENQTFERTYRDSFDLLNKYFDSNLPSFEEHLDILERYLDNWYKLSQEQPLGEFFKKNLSIEHDGDKVKIGTQRYSGELDVLRDCVTSKTYKLPKLSFLYAFFAYLDNREKISDDEFRRRLRVVNNLIQNSQEEISDLETRVGGNRMPAILRQIDSVITSGIIDTSTGISFNANQLEEEADKIEFTSKNPEYAESLYALEDHELLSGQIAIVGLEHYRIFDRFEKLFKCERDKISRALLSLGDYQQEIGRGHLVYQFGAANGNSSWINLFHRSARNVGFDETKDILVRLLSEHEEFSDTVLDGISQKYLDECEKNNSYDWRYYYIKYTAFRPDPKEERNYGKCYRLGFDMHIMVTESRVSENAYDPYIKEICKSFNGIGLARNYNGYYLDIAYIYKAGVAYRFDNDAIEKMAAEMTSDGFHNFVTTEKVPIRKNDDGTDSEDRIEKLITILSNNYDFQKFEPVESVEQPRLENSSSWNDEVAGYIQKIENEVFTLDEVYAFEDELQAKHPENHSIRPAIRRTLQELRDDGKIEFLGNGLYKKII